MSEEFINQIRAIEAAYLDKLRSRQAFIAEWSRVSNDVIKPVFRAAKMSLKTRSLSLDIEEKDDEICLIVRTIPMPASGPRKLTYRPKRHEEVVVVVGTDASREQHYGLADLSDNLVEVHVENFLKEALRLEG